MLHFRFVIKKTCMQIEALIFKCFSNEIWLCSNEIPKINFRIKYAQTIQILRLCKNNTLKKTYVLILVKSYLWTFSWVCFWWNANLFNVEIRNKMNFLFYGHFIRVLMSNKINNTLINNSKDDNQFYPQKNTNFQTEISIFSNLINFYLCCEKIFVCL